MSSSASTLPPVNYPLLRSLVEKSGEKTQRATGADISVIMPYGFEFLPAWPPKVSRHYPVLGIFADKARHETIANSFLATLLDQLNLNYHTLYETVAVAHLHGLGYYLRSKYTELPKSQLNTFSIQVVELSHAKMNVLDHYANYIATLFGALTTDNPGLPEYRDFDKSLTRRNRLWQEFIMCEYTARFMFPKDMLLSAEEDHYFQQLFKFMRKQNILELLPDVSSEPIAATAEELHLVKAFIQPRMQFIGKLLAREQATRITIESIAYYDGNEPLKASLTAKQIAAIHYIVHETYASFPTRFNEKFATAAPVSPLTFN